MLNQLRFSFEVIKSIRGSRPSLALPMHGTYKEMFRHFWTRHDAEFDRGFRTVKNYRTSILFFCGKLVLSQ